MITRPSATRYNDIDTIYVDEPNAFAHAQEFRRSSCRGFADRIKHYDQTEPPFTVSGRGRNRSHPATENSLSLGGSIVIEQTEHWCDE